MANAPNLPNVLSEVFGLLEPLESADRQKVIGSVLTLLGEAPTKTASPANNQNDGDGKHVGEFGSKATRWMNQHKISVSAIEDIFHKEGDDVEIIANEVAGQGKKAKSRNCYLLSGIRSLLESDEPKFTDAEAVALCKHMGCHDQANHAKTRSELGNSVAGNKSGGFTLPAPGLRAAADLVKTMATES